MFLCVTLTAVLCSQEFRVAFRDGLERIQLSDHATVGDLKKQINANLGIPVEDITLSRDKDLVRPPRQDKKHSGGKTRRSPSP